MASRSGAFWFPCSLRNTHRYDKRAAIDSASARALAEVYWASCSAKRFESSRSR